jgi:hypothetical protein
MKSGSRFSWRGRESTRSRKAGIAVVFMVISLNVTKQRVLDVSMAWTGFAMTPTSALMGSAPESIASCADR